MGKQNKLEFFRKILEIAIQILDDEDLDRAEFYSCLPEEIWDETDDAVQRHRSMDEYIALNAIKYPELHYLMRKLVKLITDYNLYERVIWDQDEEQAGGAIARELALHNKEDVVLFARFISSNDLNHEVYQAEDMDAVMEKWGACKETYAIVAARWFTPGQDRYTLDYDLISEAMKKESEAEALIAMVAKWFKQQWFPPYTINICYEEIEKLLKLVLAEALELSEADIKEIIESKIATSERDNDDEDDEDDFDEDEENAEDNTGRVFQVQDKKTLETILLHYEIDNSIMVVNYQLTENKAFNFATPGKLQAAIADIEAECREKGYAYNIEEGTPCTYDLLEAYKLKPVAQKQISLLPFFTPAGKKTAVEKMTEEYFTGHKMIPCKKIHLFRKVFDFRMFICDEAGKRILDTTEYVNQHFWQFNSSEEMQAALEGMKGKFISEGYELTFEETQDYAFDYMMGQMKEVAKMMQEQEAQMSED